MLKKTITYIDYNGVERTEDFYFNLSEAELFEMNYTAPGGLETRLRNIIQAKDVPSIIAIFKEIILKAYGIKSEDGKRFIKSPEVTAEFQQTEAFSQLYVELATDDVKAAAFIKGIMPTKVQDGLTDDLKAQAAERLGLTNVAKTE